jgi:hypothetical protein
MPVSVEVWPVNPWNTVSAAFADQQRPRRRIAANGLVLIFGLQILSDLYLLPTTASPHAEEKPGLSRARNT